MGAWVRRGATAQVEMYTRKVARVTKMGTEVKKNPITPPSSAFLRMCTSSALRFSPSCEEQEKIRDGGGGCAKDTISFATRVWGREKMVECARWEKIKGTM